MTIIDFQEHKDSRDSQVSLKDILELRRNIQNMDVTDFLNPHFDPFAEYTEEEKAEARKQYATQLKEYRKEKRAYDFAMARYKQGLTDEYPSNPTPIIAPPLALQNEAWQDWLDLSDEDREKRMVQAEATLDDIVASAHASVAAEKAAIEKAKMARRQLIQQIIAFHCPALV